MQYQRALFCVLLLLLLFIVTPDWDGRCSEDSLPIAKSSVLVIGRLKFVNSEQIHFYHFKEIIEFLQKGF